MRRIGFQARWIEPILSGVKTSTIRRASGPLPRPGEVVGLRCRYDQPPFAHARIVSVSPLALGQVDEQIARSDGFEGISALCRAILDLYGHVPLARIIFELVERPSEPKTQS